MLPLWILREPSLCLGLVVFVFAAAIFPLHLGWIGASWLTFAGYLVIAAALFSVVDALMHPTYYPAFGAVIPQSVLSLSALALPALLAFAVGSTLGPVDEAFEEQVCASQGAEEADTAEAEFDDAFDVTADCINGR